MYKLNAKACGLGLVLALFLQSVVGLTADKGDTKASWKTLTNENGWSIQYPKDWLNSEEGDEFVGGRARKGWASQTDDAVQIRSPVASSKSKEHSAWIKVSVRNVPKDKKVSIDDLKKYVGTVGQRDVVSIEEGHELRTLGFPAYSGIVSENVSENGEIITITSRNVEGHYNGKRVTFQYHEASDSLGFSDLPRGKWKFEKTFDEILSTFRFTK